MKLNVLGENKVHLPYIFFLAQKLVPILVAETCCNGREDAHFPSLCFCKVGLGKAKRGCQAPGRKGLCPINGMRSLRLCLHINYTFLNYTLEDAMSGSLSHEGIAGSQQASPRIHTHTHSPPIE